MEKSRNAVQKVAKMKELGIYNGFLKNSEDRVRELYGMYSFSEEQNFWFNIVDELRSEI